MFRTARWVVLACAVATTVTAGAYFLARLRHPLNVAYGPELQVSALVALGLWVVFAFMEVAAVIVARLAPAAGDAEVEIPRAEPAPDAATPGRRRPSPHPVPPRREFEVITARARVPKPRIVEPEWDCDRPTTQITADGKLVALNADGTISETRLPDGVAKQIFELGRRIGRRDSA